MAAEHYTIVLKSKGHHDEGPVAAAGIAPGMAVSMDANGKYNQAIEAQANALKGGLMVAKEDALQGKTVDDLYNTVDETLFFYIPVPGDHVNLLVAAGENISVNDVLVEAGGGSGLFNEAAGTETKFRAVALEGPGALAADTLVACRIL